MISSFPALRPIHTTSHAGFQPSSSAPRINTGPRFGDEVRFARVRFGAAHGFSEADLNDIRKELKHFRYGRDLEGMLGPATRAFYHQGRLILRNYNYPPNGREERGVCHELARACLKKLQTRYGDRYEFTTVIGTEPQYFRDQLDTHTFLLGWAKRHDATVRQQLKENRFIIPEEAVVIDPSFGVAGNLQTVGFYRMNGRITDAVPTNVDDTWDSYTLMPLETLKGRPDPLGYLSELAPGVPIGPGTKPLVFAVYCLDREGKPAVRLMRKDTPGADVYQWKTWREEVTPNSLLRRFVEKIESDMRQPPDLSLFYRLEADRITNSAIAWLKRATAADGMTA